jgi:hypothetical protein
VNAPVAKAPPPPQLHPFPSPGHMIDDGLAVARDHLAAEKELRSRFIIDDKKKKGRLPNEITSKEFHELAGTYSDIRLGRGDLTIDPGKAKDPDQYRSDMMNDIGDIMQTKSGRYLIEHLHDAQAMDDKGEMVHHHTTLSPALLDGKPDTDLTGEHGKETNLGFGTVKDDKGTPGIGTDALVNANPNMDVIENDTAGKVTGHIRSDVALYHELVHAYTDTHGFTEFGPVAHPGTDLDTSGTAPSRNEYQAVGLGEFAGQFLTENNYRSERHGVAKSGKGIAGDELMPQRERYNSTDDYLTIGGK